ncbi:hypothetical protein RBU60_06040 [Mesonia sp. MT50]|uniref:DUF1737 domain-containing protein n=1 Tax=Mesonia profundi TaxID=3070998 RepID=A0ABU1A0J4_9FLAO|nr:hypothetical protein [Mesonia profundi]MDQ7917129.1 hypothetical protein [Mesonia profundi]
MKEIKIIQKNSIIDIEKEINKHLKEGWKVKNNIVVDDCTLTIMMSKK